MQITSAEGKFKVFALDQSNSMKKAIKRCMKNRARPRTSPMKTSATPRFRWLRKFRPTRPRSFWMSVRPAQAMRAGAIGRRSAFWPAWRPRDAGTPGEVELGWSVGQIREWGECRQTVGLHGRGK